MIRFLISRAVCNVRGHRLEPAGSCPFTGVTYDYCHRCTGMVPREEAV